MATGLKPIPFPCSGLPKGADVIAVAPILAPEGEAQMQGPVSTRPSRKRLVPGADMPGSNAVATEAGVSGVGPSGAEPRKQKRRLLTGMAVVWKYFGVRDPKAQA